ARAGSFLADPEQPLTVRADLVDQRQILMSTAILNLVHTDGAHRLQAALRQAPGHDIFDRVEDLLPTGTERLRGLLPGQPARPVRQKQHVGFAQGVLALGPRHRLHLHPAAAAVDPAHGVEQHHRKTPDRNKLEAALLKSVVTGRRPLAAGAARFGATPWTY